MSKTAKAFSVVGALMGAIGVVATLMAWHPAAGSSDSSWRVALTALFAAASLAGIALLTIEPVSLRRSLGSFVREAAEYEIAMYRNPEAHDEQDNHRYFLPRSEGGKQIDNIEAAVKRLLNHGWHYGAASRADVFTVHGVHVQDDEAVVRTSERWYLPLLDEQGDMVNNPAGQYRDPWHPGSDTVKRVDYFLVRRHGQWYVTRTTDAYAKYD